MSAFGRHPSQPFACLNEACRSPLACASFGYCRGLNMLPVGRPICTGCLKRADELDEYRGIVELEGDPPTAEHCDAYVRAEEGTYNPANGHFLCTLCYVAAGMPTAPGGWVAP